MAPDNMECLSHLLRSSLALVSWLMSFASVVGVGAASGSAGTGDQRGSCGILCMKCGTLLLEHAWLCPAGMGNSHGAIKKYMSCAPYLGR